MAAALRFASGESASSSSEIPTRAVACDDEDVCATQARPRIRDGLRARRDEILALPARRGASNVRVFGSVARGEASERGDLDFLVDRDPDRSLLDLGGLLMDPRELLSAEVAVITEKRSPGVFVAWSSTRPRRL